MIGFPTALENFFFKFADFSGRATRAEFWWIMPVIWAALLGSFYLDVTGIWDDLLSRQRPSLNPLSYTSLLLFVLTLVPRFSVTVRRLHDSGRSARWAMLPYTALFLSTMAAFGIASAALTESGDSTASVLALAAIVGVASIGYSNLSPDTIWEGVFSTAQALNVVDWGQLWAQSTAGLQKPDLAAGAANLQQSIATEPQTAFAALAISSILILGPFVAMALYLIFLLLPSSRGENSYGFATGPGVSKLKTADGDNPLAAYAVLFEKSDEEKKAMEVARKIEIQELYQRRVLGREPE